MLFAENASSPQIWAVEDTAVQITWGDLPEGDVHARWRDKEASVHHRGGAGSLDLTGLPAGRALEIDLSWDGGSALLSADTLSTPPGQELTRFATISDLHLGIEHWGALHTMKDTSGHPVPFALRCAVAAITEAIAWGAEYLVIKGDAADDETPEHFALVGQLVDRFPRLPMMLLPGNHDVHFGGKHLPVTVGERELPYIRRVDHVDLPGIRIVGADTTLPGRGWGTLDRVAAPIVEAASEADSAVFVATHQQMQTTRLPRQWPPGIPAPASLNLIDALDQLDNPVMMSAGHTHRNRSWNRGSVLLTEVSSTKDWPGAWAGYAVHEGGLRQVVRRVSSPDAIQWTEYSRGALNGLWARWSPGTIDQRCMTFLWDPAETAPGKAKAALPGAVSRR